MAVGFATYLFSPGAQEMFRVCIAEAGRFPELGAAFHASGPARAHTLLVAFFEAARVRGRSRDRRPGDRRRAVHRPLQSRPLPARAPRRPGARRGRDRPIADEAVRTFLARYGKDAAERPPVDTA